MTELDSSAHCQPVGILDLDELVGGPGDEAFPPGMPNPLKNTFGDPPRYDFYLSVSSQPVVTSQLGTVNNIIQVKKTDFEVFDALMVDSQKCSDMSGMNSYFIPVCAGGGRVISNYAYFLLPLPLEREPPNQWM